MAMSMAFHKDVAVYRRIHPAAALIFSDTGRPTQMDSVHHLLLSVGFRSTELLPIKPGLFQFEYMLPSSRCQSAWDEENSSPYSQYPIILLVLIQYFLLKGIHKTVGKHQQLKPSIVGSVAVRDSLNLSKGVEAVLWTILTVGDSFVRKIRCSRIIWGK
jgi:hypothetical protein